MRCANLRGEGPRGLVGVALRCISMLESQSFPENALN